MMICTECGYVFQEDDAAEAEGMAVPYGEGFTHETFAACPCCGSTDIEGAEICYSCMEHYLQCDVKDGYCKDCRDEYLESYKNDFEHCYKIVDDEGSKESVEINQFLAAMFDSQEIERILMDALRAESKQKEIDCSGFILDDIGWFIDKTREVSD